MCAFGRVYLQRPKVNQVVEVAGTNVEERVVGDISTNNECRYSLSIDLFV